MKLKRFLSLVFIISVLASFGLKAQEGYVPTQENLDNREWFKDNKYGLFVHWGVYSLMGGGGDLFRRRCAAS